MKISEASDIKLGTSSVSKVTLGTTQVWPNEHLLYGEIVTQELGLPAVNLDGTEITQSSLDNCFLPDDSKYFASICLRWISSRLRPSI